MDFNTHKEHGGPEKRKSPRLNIVIIFYSVVGKGDLGKICVIKNISAHGVCIIVPEEIQTKETLSLKIHLTEGLMPIHAKGDVIWSHKMVSSVGVTQHNYALGVEFTEIRGPDRKKILDYVSRYLD